VINVRRHISVPLDLYTNVVETKEWSCLEQGLDHKFYAAGVGSIRELAVANGQEMIELVSVTH
jgi:hypothetical protein